MRIQYTKVNRTGSMPTQDDEAEMLTKAAFENDPAAKAMAKFIMECVRSMKTGDQTYWDGVTDFANFRDLFKEEVKRFMPPA